MKWNVRLLAAAVGAFLILGGAGTARADGGNCSQRIHREEQKLLRDINRHGYNSRQAAHRRARIEELRESCSRHSHVFGGNDDRWNRRRGWRNGEREDNERWERNNRDRERREQRRHRGGGRHD